MFLQAMLSISEEKIKHYFTVGTVNRSDFPTLGVAKFNTAKSNQFVLGAVHTDEEKQKLSDCLQNYLYLKGSEITLLFLRSYPPRPRLQYC